MRRFGVSARRGRARWAVLACALLAVGAYIAFDVLDVDGSDLRGRPANGAAVAEPAGTEDKEARPRHGPSTPEVPALAAAAFAYRVAAQARGSGRRAVTAIVCARRDWFFPRAHMGQPADSSDAPTADPA